VVNLLFSCIAAMPFAFCTREKHPWTQFAELAKTGSSTLFLSEVSDPSTPWAYVIPCKEMTEAFAIGSPSSSCRVWFILACSPLQDGDYFPYTGEG